MLELSDGVGNAPFSFSAAALSSGFSLFKLFFWSSLAFSGSAASSSLTSSSFLTDSLAAASLPLAALFGF